MNIKLIEIVLTDHAKAPLGVNFQKHGNLNQLSIEDYWLQKNAPTLAVFHAASFPCLNLLKVFSIRILS